MNFSFQAPQRSRLSFSQTFTVGMVLSLLALSFNKALESNNTETHARGGKDVIRIEDPLALSTVGVGDDSISMVWCTGTLIARKWVVTAAHCWQDAIPTHVVFGPGTRKAISIKNNWIHERFNFENPLPFSKTSRHWDLALIELEEEALAEYKPVPLAPKDFQTGVGKLVRLAGFGEKNSQGDADGTLRTVDAKCILCVTTAKHFQVGNWPNQGVCPGDSGGPAYILNENSSIPQYVLGVLHRGSCTLGQATYVNLRSMHDWLSCKSALDFTNGKDLKVSARNKACDASKI